MTPQEAETAIGKKVTVNVEPWEGWTATVTALYRPTPISTITHLVVTGLLPGGFGLALEPAHVTLTERKEP